MTPSGDAQHLSIPSRAPSNWPLAVCLDTPHSINHYVVDQALVALIKWQIFGSFMSYPLKSFKTIRTQFVQSWKIYCNVIRMNWEFIFFSLYGISLIGLRGYSVSSPCTVYLFIILDNSEKAKALLQSAVKMVHRGTKIILGMFLILLFIFCQWQTA